MENFDDEYKRLESLLKDKRYATVLRGIQALLDKDNTSVIGAITVTNNEMQRLENLQKDAIAKQLMARRQQLQLVQLYYSDATKSFDERASIINEVLLDEETFGTPIDYDDGVRVAIQNQRANINELCDDAFWTDIKLMMLVDYCNWYLGNASAQVLNKTKNLRRIMQEARKYANSNSHTWVESLNRLDSRIVALEEQTTPATSGDAEVSQTLGNVATLYELDRILTANPDDTNLRRQYAIMAFDNARKVFQSATGYDIDTFDRLSPERQVFKRVASLEEIEKLLSQAYIYLSPKDRVDTERIGRYIPDDARRLEHNPSRDELDPQRRNYWTLLNKYTEDLLERVIAMRQRLKEIEDKVMSHHAKSVIIPDLHDLYEFKKYTTDPICDKLLNGVGLLLYRQYEESLKIWQWFYVDEHTTNTGEKVELEDGQREIQTILGMLPHNVDYRLNFESLLTTVSILHDNFRHYKKKKKDVERMYDNFLKSHGAVKDGHYKSLQMELPVMIYFERSKREQIQIDLDRYLREKTILQPGGLLRLIKDARRDLVHNEINRLRNTIPQSRFFRAYAEYQMLIILKSCIDLDERPLTGYDAIANLKSGYEELLHQLQSSVSPLFHLDEEFKLLHQRIQSVIDTFTKMDEEHYIFSHKTKCYHYSFLNYLNGLIYPQKSAQENARLRYREFFIYYVWKPHNERARNDPTDECHQVALVDYNNFRIYFDGHNR